MNQRSKLFISALLAAMFLFGAPGVFAHANLVRSEPAADSAQPVPPTVVRLWFSEEIEPRLTSVAVADTRGKAFVQGASQGLPDDPKAAQVSLDALPPGLYTVVWRAVSAADGHTTAGSFSFTVGDQPLAEPSPRQIISQVQAALSVREIPPLREIVVRWLNLLTLILLVGSFAFPILILFPVIRAWRALDAHATTARSFESAAPSAAPPQTLDAAAASWRARWLHSTAVILVLCAVMAVAVLINQSISVGGGAGALATILTGTRFGYVWLFRAAGLIALGVLLARARFDTTALRAEWLGAGLCLWLVVSQSLNSHSAAASEPPLLPLLTDVVHILGAAIWVGGLAQWLVTLPSFLKALDETERVPTLAALIARFSLVAFSAVVSVVLTGAFATLVQVGSFEALFYTLYGTTLFVKIFLLLPLLLLAALNLIVTRPALARAKGITQATAVIRHFNWTVALEIFFGGALIFIVGVMTSTAPGRAAYDPAPKLWLDTQRVDDLSITLGVSPALIGPNDFDVYLRDASGQPVVDATVVRLLGTMREMTMGTQELTLQSQGNGHYTVRANLLSMVGNWNIETLARRAGHDDARSTFAMLAYTEPLLPAQPTLAIALTQLPIQIGLGLALFGLVFGSASALLLKPRSARWSGLAGALIVASIGAVVVTQTPLAPSTRPIVVVPSVPEFARLTRMPFRADAKRIALGGETYQKNCAVCHGDTGKGDGKQAAQLNPRPGALTTHVPLHTDGELFWFVMHGIPGTAMPAWGDKALLTEEECWQVIAYLRAAFQGNPTPTPAP